MNGPHVGTRFASGVALHTSTQLRKMEVYSLVASIAEQCYDTGDGVT